MWLSLLKLSISTYLQSWMNQTTFTRKVQVKAVIKAFGLSFLVTEDRVFQTRHYLLWNKHQKMMRSTLQVSCKKAKLDKGLESLSVMQCRKKSYEGPCNCVGA
ncbi:hypothetical protein Syun_014631 [Stephania yunnanensis]|uniref:Uncharacterized protein n=1 Tax=Stephania yunnanensis TaxID=152371 RepID=A0AAP0JKS9_9MAGN